MSTTEITNILGIDGRLNPNSRKHKTNIILQGGSNTSYMRTQAQGPSASNVSFNVTVPNGRTYLPRVVYFRLQGKTTFRGTSPGLLVGQELLQCPGLPHAAGVGTGNVNCFGPRCDPLNQAITQTIANINGYPIGSNTNAYSRILQRFHRSIGEENTEMSMSPMMPDNSLNYSDTYGTNISPLASAEFNPLQDPRGCFPSIVVTSNEHKGANSVAEVEWSFITPIILSPFVYSKNYQEQLAFVQITSFTFNFLLGGRGSGLLGGLSGSLWSADVESPGAGTILSADTIISGAWLYNQFITPPDWQTIPRQVNYAFSKPSFLPNQFQTALASGATQDYQSVAGQTNITPQAIYLWVSEADTAMDMTKTDAMQFSIEKVTLQWDAGAPVLSTLSKYDIYQSLYVVKGGNMSYKQWGGNLDGAGALGLAVYDQVGGSGIATGSLVCIHPGIDIPLMPGDAPGCGNQKHTFIFNVTVKNISGRAIAPQVNVMFIEEGVFQIDDLVANSNVAIFQPADVKSVDNMDPISYTGPSSVLGGSFWQDISNFIGKVARPVFNAVRPSLPGAVGDIGDAILTAHGKGMRKKSHGGALIGGAKLKMLM